MTEPFQMSDDEKKRLLFAELKKLKLIDLDSFPYRLQENVIGVYTREQLKECLKSPEVEANQKQLRKISRFLYNASTPYKRLVQYFSSILTLDYYIEPYGLNMDKVKINPFKAAYNKITNTVDNMNIKHEFNKAQQYAYRDGIFYGYVHRNDSSFFVQYLDPDYCKVTFVEDGLFGFAFNFQYFKTYPERLTMFPEEFQQIYERLFSKENNKKKSKANYWENLSIENTVCIKSDEATWYPIPPFVGLFEDILSIADFKSLQKSEEEIGNYKLLFQKIPLDEKSTNPNEFKITYDFAQVFHNNIEESLPKQVGLITSPMDVQDISFERDKVDRNKVFDATKQYWDSAGVSQILFSGDTTGSIGLNLAIKTDESIAFGMLRQIERWVNRQLKQQSGTYKFRVKMPDITVFNRKEVQEQLLKNAQYGLPVKVQLASTLGIHPSSVTGMTILENDILKLQDKFIPLVSSHTLTNDENGRPTKDGNDLSDGGAKTADNDANNNRAE